MFAKTHDDVRRIYDSVDTVKRLSDRIIGIGPINIIGLDGILAWFPGVAPVYSVLAGGFILLQGARARCDLVTLVAAFIVLAMDSGISLFDGLVPVIPAGSILDTFFQGHLYAAHMIQKDIEKTHYVEGSASQAHRDGSHQENLGEMRSTKGKKRIVYLG
jgi:cytochrome b subunit of formate dehydrogenase